MMKIKLVCTGDMDEENYREFLWKNNLEKHSTNNVKQLFSTFLFYILQIGIEFLISLV